MDSDSPASSLTGNTISLGLSYPAILQNSKPQLNHLQGNKSRKTTKSASLAVERKEGGSRRALNRLRNSTFADNPHSQKPKISDYSPSASPYSSSFAPPPNSSTFPRSLYVAPTLPTTFGNEISNQLGKFKMSTKGIRKNLYKGGDGGRAGVIVEKVEKVIRGWILGDVRSMRRIIDSTLVAELNDGKSKVSEDSTSYSTKEGEMIESQAIVEIRRSIQQMEFIIGDSYSRYVCHCLARWYSLISFSKEVGGVKITFLLRPQISNPIASTLDTPPTTDLSASDFTASASDFTASASEIESSVGDEDEAAEWEDFAIIENRVEESSRPGMGGRTLTNGSSADEGGESSTKEDTEEEEEERDFHSSDEEDDEDGEIFSAVRAINNITLPATPRPPPPKKNYFSSPQSGQTTPRALRHSFHTNRPSNLSREVACSASPVEPMVNPVISPSSTSASAMASRLAALTMTNQDDSGERERRHGNRSNNSSPSRSPSRVERARSNIIGGSRSNATAAAIFNRQEELPKNTFAKFLGFEESA